MQMVSLTRLWSCWRQERRAGERLQGMVSRSRALTEINDTLTRPIKAESLTSLSIYAYLSIVLGAHVSPY
jgi:hypothetical protein